MRRNAYDNETAKKIDSYFTEGTCAECGQAFTVDGNGIANHLNPFPEGDDEGPDGENLPCGIDHDADADHTPFDRDLDDIEPEEAKVLAREWLDEVFEDGSTDLDMATEYADGHDHEGVTGIIMANWNDVPKKVQTVLERAGYELEWSDCVSTCSGCCKVIRTEPTHYGWKRQFWVGDGEILCSKCVADDPESYLDSLRGNPNAAHTLTSVDLSEKGYIPVWGEFENGFHAGQDDDPKAIAKALEKRGVEDFIFSLDSVGQFDAHFTVWVKDDSDMPFAVSIEKGWRGDRLITNDEWRTSHGLTAADDETNGREPVLFAIIEDAREHLTHLLVDGKVWFYAGLASGEGKCKVAPNVALDQALRAAGTQINALPAGPGIAVSKLSIDPETGEGVAITRMVSPEDFVAGKALE